MMAPRLTAIGRVIEIGGGKVYVDAPPNCPGEDGCGIPASADAERAYAPLLLRDAAVRITVEPVERPRDLAARIRALLDMHVTRWLDADGDDATILSVTMEELKGALADARRGRPVAHHVRELRSRAARSHYDSWSAIYSRAADELEAIVRDAVEPR